MKTRFRLMPVFCAASAILLIVSPAAQAGYIVTLRQVGSDVVATGSGAFDLTGLPDPATAFAQSFINPFIGNIVTGSSNAPTGACDAYEAAITGPSSFGRGSPTSASSGTGDIAGMLFFGGRDSLLLVPEGYVSGAALLDSAIYNNTTLVSLFVTPGTYVWTWGDGANQRFTLQVGSVGVPRVPDRGSTVSLLGCALLGLAGLRRKLGC
jgi:VPDSG-CTERM motif